MNEPTTAMATACTALAWAIRGDYTAAQATLEDTTLDPTALTWALLLTSTSTIHGLTTHTHLDTSDVADRLTTARLTIEATHG